MEWWEVWTKAPLIVWVIAGIGTIGIVLFIFFVLPRSQRFVQAEAAVMKRWPWMDHPWSPGPIVLPVLIYATIKRWKP